MRITGPVRGLFGAASAGLAVLSLAYGEFATTGRTLPVWVPARHAWLAGSALLLLAAGAGLNFRRTALPGARLIGAYLSIWALTCVRDVIAGPLSLGVWYGWFEALTSLVGAWILCILLQGRSEGAAKGATRGRSLRVAQALFGVSCIFYGWSHFAYADYTASMVPVWLPGPAVLAYLTGFCHVAAGLGIVLGVLPRLAATLEALMMSLFGLLVWVPSFFTQPRPPWATPPQAQWSELVVSGLLAAAAWIVAVSLRDRAWTFNAWSRKKTGESQ